MDAELKTGRMAGRQSDTKRTRNGGLEVTMIEASQLQSIKRFTNRNQ
jgi:hypothetical protein